MRTILVGGIALAVLGCSADADTDAPEAAASDALQVVVDHACEEALVVSPDGDVVVFRGCDPDKSLVRRDLRSNATDVITTSRTAWWREARKEGLIFSSDYPRFVAWRGPAVYELPTAPSVPEADAWKIRVTPSAMAYATQEKVDRASRIAVYRSGATAPVYSAPFDTTAPSSVLLDEAAAYVASVEATDWRPTLRCAKIEEGAALTTVVLETDLELRDPPQWVPGGTTKHGALLDVGSKLRHVDFRTCAVTDLSTRPVRTRPVGRTPQHYVLTSGERVYFVEQVSDHDLRYDQPYSGPSRDARYSVKRWDAGTPASAPVELATGAGLLSSYRGTDHPAIQLSPDGEYLVYDVEPANIVAGSSIRSAPTDGGAEAVLGRSSVRGFRMFAPNIVAWSDNPGEAHVVALDGSARRDIQSPTETYYRLIVGKDAQTIFSVETTTRQQQQPYVASRRVETMGFSGPTENLLSLPWSAIRYAESDMAEPVLDNGLLILVNSEAEPGKRALVLLKP